MVYTAIMYMLRLNSTILTGRKERKKWQILLMLKQHISHIFHQPSGKGGDNVLKAGVVSDFR
jgi:hypothetical protein